MLKENQLTPKIKLRNSFQLLRASLSEDRRAEASRYIREQIIKSDASLILSFNSFRSEIDLCELNKVLSRDKRLILTKVENEELNLYQVEDFNTQIELSSFGLQEPIPHKCRKISLTQIDLALIPALAFDKDHFRLGYGKGHYDRLLVHKFPSIGVGFREQKSPILLPKDPWDLPVHKLLLG